MRHGWRGKDVSLTLKKSRTKRRWNTHIIALGSLKIGSRLYGNVIILLPSPSDVQDRVSETNYNMQTRACVKRALRSRNKIPRLTQRTAKEKGRPFLAFLISFFPLKLGSSSRSWLTFDLHQPPSSDSIHGKKRKKKEKE